MPGVTGKFLQNYSPDTIFLREIGVKTHFFVDRSRFPTYDQEGLLVMALYRLY